MPKLVITSEDGGSREVELSMKTLRIGRAPENDLSLPDPTKGVSRVHAELRYENGRYVIVDLNSQNGTWIDGNRVQRADVASGSEIAMGPYRLTLQGAGAEPSLPSRQSDAVDVPPPEALEAPAAEAPAAPFDAPLPPPAPPRATKPVPVPAVAAAASAPKAAPPPMRPVRPVTPPPPQDRGPVAASAGLSKPALFGGLFAAVLAIVLLGWFYAPFSPAGSGGGTRSTAADNKPISETSAQIIELHLAEGKALVEKKEYEAAIREHFDPILAIDPRHAETIDLKTKAQEALQQQKQETAAGDAAPSGAATTTPPPAAAPVPSSGPGNAPARGTIRGARSGAADIQPSPRRGNETVEQWRARNANLQAQYNAARTALNRKQYEAAISGFEGVIKGDAAFLDAAQLLARSRNEQRAEQSKTGVK